MTAELLSSISLGFAGLLLYVYYAYKGQFENSEDVKYQMFREEDDAKIP